jgi:archaemetzincin
MHSRIRIVPINAIDQTFLSRLALCLEERFLSTIDVASALTVPATAVNSQRGQMFLSSLISKIARAQTESPEQADGLRLAVTEFDLYKTGHRFLFGDADRQAGIAVVSLHRLRAEFYGEEPDDNLLFQRALKESVCELGHIVGLRACYDARCAMHHSASVFETDNKMSHFCSECDKRSRARR